MLKEALQYMDQNSAEFRKAGLRIVATPGVIPGRYYYACDTGVVYGEYELAAPRFITKSIDGFAEFIYLTMPATNNRSAAAEGNQYSSWHVFIGNATINGYLVPEDSDGQYVKCPDLLMSLTPTEAWKWVAEGKSIAPQQLMRDIRRLFTMHGAAQGEGNPPIQDLVPLLKKISVRIVQNSTQNSSSSNETLGLDVEKQLSLGGEMLPDVVEVPVRMFKECLSVCIVKMNCYFDFEKKDVVLEPMAESLLQAELQTGQALEEAIAPPDGFRGQEVRKPIIAHASYIRPPATEVTIRG